jgi:activator of HSP90 ATPase
MALPPSTANWHWKNKNVSRWGKEWFERELCTLTVTGDADKEIVTISKVTDVEGDIELGQRKSKCVGIVNAKLHD